MSDDEDPSIPKTATIDTEIRAVEASLEVEKDQRDASTRQTSLQEQHEVQLVEMTVKIPPTIKPAVFTKPKNARPDHFLSLRLSSEAFAPFREHVNRSHEPFSRFLVSAPSMHFTLGLLHLGDDVERRERAIRTLVECSEITRELAKFPIELQGVGHFNHRVVYARPKPGEAHDRLLELAGNLQARFEAANLLATDDIPTPPSSEPTTSPTTNPKPRTKPFILHATLLKLKPGPRNKPRNSTLEPTPRSIPKEIINQLMERFSEHHWQAHMVDRIQLCVMQGPKMGDGYYSSIGEELVLGGGGNEEGGDGQESL